MCLLEYRNLPISGLDLSPTQILFSRPTRTKLPVHSELLKPKIDISAHNKISNNQFQYKFYHDKKCRPFNHSFKEGDNAVSKTVHDNTWKPVKILSSHQSPRAYTVLNQNGNIVRRTSNYLKPSQTEFAVNAGTDDFPNVTENDLNNVNDNDKLDNFPCERGRNVLSENLIVTNNQNAVPNAVLNNDEVKNKTELQTRSGRFVKAPAKYKDFVCY